MKIDSWPARFLTGFAYYLLKIWGRTLRFDVDDRVALATSPVRENYIGALWHNRLLFICYALKRFVPHRPGAGLISKSRDGDLVAALTQRFGFAVVRGSSSKMGAGALRGLSSVLESGLDVLMTPDGPRGPVYEPDPGAIFLAQKTGAPILPINLEFSSCWRLNSWDRFILPRPFSKVRLIFGPLFRVRSTATPEEFETERLGLRDAMMALVEIR